MARFFTEDTEIEERVIDINRVAKVVKGGRRFNLTSLVAVGDRNGNVGVGHGKGSEVPLAVRKATAKAKKSMVHINLKGSTIPHQIIGRFGAARVLLKPASPGTGIIAGGPVRAVVELAGVKDILAKSLGSSNPINLARATMQGLIELKNAADVAALRGVNLIEVDQLEKLEEIRLKEREETLKRLKEEQEKEKAFEEQKRKSKRRAPEGRGQVAAKSVKTEEMNKESAKIKETKAKEDIKTEKENQVEEKKEEAKDIKESTVKSQEEKSEAKPKEAEEDSMIEGKTQTPIEDEKAQDDGKKNEVTKENEQTKGDK